MSQCTDPNCQHCLDYATGYIKTQLALALKAADNAANMAAQSAPNVQLELQAAKAYLESASKLLDEIQTAG